MKMLRIAGHPEKRSSEGWQAGADSSGRSPQVKTAAHDLQLMAEGRLRVSITEALRFPASRQQS